MLFFVPGSVQGKDTKVELSPYRLVARSSPFQGEERGSEPRRDAITQRFKSATVYQQSRRCSSAG